MVSCDAHAYTARITKIIPLEQPFTVTFFRHGFMPKYLCWTKHGEKGVMMENNEEVDYDDAQILIHAGFSAFDDDTAIEEPEADAAKNEPPDELGQALCGEWKIVRVKKRG